MNKKDYFKELFTEQYEVKKHTIKSGLCDIFRSMFWSVILEQEKKTGTCAFQNHLDNIIRSIVDSSGYSRSESGDSPIYDEEEIKEDVLYIKKVLKKWGITSNKNNY